MKLRDYILLTCLLLLLFSGCTKRYWYRTKIDSSHSKKYSVEINIVNLSPEFLSQEFADDMHKAAAKALKRFGYYETHIKSPRFIYRLFLRCDSRFIVFEADFYDSKYGPKWNQSDYIYFFEQKRDITRSTSVVRRLIRISEQKRYQY